MAPSIFSPPAASRAIGEKLIVRMRAEWRGAAARVSAASALLDPGWGKPQQTHTGEDGDIRVTIRTITAGAPPMPSCRIPRPAGSLGAVAAS